MTFGILAVLFFIKLFKKSIYHADELKLLYEKTTRNIKCENLKSCEIFEGKITLQSVLFSFFLTKIPRLCSHPMPMFPP